MQKSMIIFMAMSFSLAHVPHSFSMEPNRSSTTGRGTIATLQAEMQKLDVERQELKEEHNRLVGLYKNHDTAVKRSFIAMSTLLVGAYLLSWLFSGISSDDSSLGK